MTKEDLIIQTLERLEKKMDKRFCDMEKRLDTLNNFRAYVLGVSATVAFLISITVPLARVGGFIAIKEPSSQIPKGMLEAWIQVLIKEKAINLPLGPNFTPILLIAMYHHFHEGRDIICCIWQDLEHHPEPSRGAKRPLRRGLLSLRTSSHTPQSRQ